ncbi:MAG: hypothetical protein K2H82_03805 [Oscillospiraceae bacterium]|nr:hypothetical protein [Oscillospiraceae bacterium]
MSFQLCDPVFFPVQIGDFVIYLSEYQITQSSSLKESGSVDGNVILTSCVSLGSRLKLKGKLAPMLSPDQVIATLSGRMLHPENLQIRNLTFPGAMLCSFTVGENSEMPDISLVFYCNQKPVLPTEESEHDE